MIKNWKITCFLLSPLCGDPPNLDALLEYELARRLGYKHSNKLTRNVPLSEIKKPPIPLAKRTVAGHDIYCCSNPIIPKPKAEWSDHQSKRFDTDMVALILHRSQRKKLLTSSGPYKSRFSPIRIRLIDRIVWFARGDRGEINKLLKKIVALGHCRNIGYGTIDRWEYEEVDANNSLYASYKGKKIVMKTIPVEAARNYYGYRKSYGGAFPPYWHPETNQEIAIPC